MTRYFTAASRVCRSHPDCRGRLPGPRHPVLGQVLVPTRPARQLAQELRVVVRTDEARTQLRARRPCGRRRTARRARRGSEQGVGPGQAPDQSNCGSHDPAPRMGKINRSGVRIHRLRPVPPDRPGRLRCHRGAVAPRAGAGPLPRSRAASRAPAPPAGRARPGTPGRRPGAGRPLPRPKSPFAGAASLAARAGPARRSDPRSRGWAGGCRRARPSVHQPGDAPSDEREQHDRHPETLRQRAHLAPVGADGVEHRVEPDGEGGEEQDPAEANNTALTTPQRQDTAAGDDTDAVAHDDLRELPDRGLPGPIASGLAEQPRRPPLPGDRADSTRGMTPSESARPAAASCRTPRGSTVPGRQPTSGERAAAGRFATRPRRLRRRTTAPASHALAGGTRQQG